MAACLNVSPASVTLAGDAFLSGGVYTCPTGTHVLVTPSELASLTGNVNDWTAADGLIVGWTIAAIWLSVAGVMFIGKIVKGATENDTSES